MGMFDTILIKGVEFQTKQLVNHMRRFHYNEEDHTFTIKGEYLGMGKDISYTAEQLSALAYNGFECQVPIKRISSKFPSDTQVIVIIDFQPEKEKTKCIVRTRNNSLRSSYTFAFDLLLQAIKKSGHLDVMWLFRQRTM